MQVFVMFPSTDFFSRFVVVSVTPVNLLAVEVSEYHYWMGASTKRRIGSLGFWVCKRYISEVFKH